MLTIICGEDHVAAREYFKNLKDKYREKHIEIRLISSSEVEEMKKWLLDSPSLFFEKKVFFTENLTKALKRKKNPGTLLDLANIAKNNDVELYVWEDGLSARIINTNVSMAKLAKIARIKEFKPKENIFQLLDACFPSNKQKFIALLRDLLHNTNQEFIFMMLARHVRNLILAKENALSAKLPFWQKNKISSQAKFWQKEKLMIFYESLFRIERRAKTSASQTLSQSLEITACLLL